MEEKELIFVSDEFFSYLGLEDFPSWFDEIDAEFIRFHLPCGHPGNGFEDDSGVVHPAFVKIWLAISSPTPWYKTFMQRPWRRPSLFSDLVINDFNGCPPSLFLSKVSFLVSILGTRH